jgi:hypothetical protein
MPRPRKLGESNRLALSTFVLVGDYGVNILRIGCAREGWGTFPRLTGADLSRAYTETGH